MAELILDAVKTLYAGGVVAHPTETCYGLAVDIFQKSAVEKLYRLKSMPFSKQVSVLVRDLEEAQQYGEFSTLAVQYALKYWPGALTIIVPRKPSVPLWINPGDDTIGFRVSSNKKTRELLA
ncbi:L-threonylcarbamoyladenylate synthase, partial [Candidatus Peregrinibacteria bacterium]|nr:L-threonylcarbamoyladenylate synthase [Candidatus Peregrinibacteria bacterium]